MQISTQGVFLRNALSCNDIVTLKGNRYKERRKKKYNNKKSQPQCILKSMNAHYIHGRPEI